MKRVILATILAFAAIAMSAKPPRFAIEKYFDGRYNNNPNVSTTTVKSDHGYFRSLSIAPSEKAIIEDVSKAVELDKKHAASVCDQWSGGRHDVVLSIFANEQPISIGLNAAPGQNTEVFISGSPEAFK